MNVLNWEIEELYLDYVNNFISLTEFAAYYGLTVREASIVVDGGQQINYWRTEVDKA